MRGQMLLHHTSDFTDEMHVSLGKLSVVLLTSQMLKETEMGNLPEG